MKLLSLLNPFRRFPWLKELQPLIGLAAVMGAFWLVNWSSRRSRPGQHVAAPTATLSSLWRASTLWVPQAGGWQRPVVLGALALTGAGLMVLLWRWSRPGPSKILGRIGTWPFRHLVRLGLRASTTHMWLLAPIEGGKSTLLARLILGEIRGKPDPHIEGRRHRRKRRKMAIRKLGPGRGVLAIDPNGALTKRVLSRLSPEERQRVTVIDVADDDPPPVNVLEASDPELAADFVVSLFRALPGGGSIGAIQLDILRRAVEGLARVDGPTLFELKKWLWANAEKGEEKAIAGLVARLGPFLSPRLKPVIGRPEREDVFAAIDSGRTVILRMREELGRDAAALLTTVFLARASDRIQRREPDYPHRHCTVVLDELGALVREGHILARMLDQFRSRNVCVVCAHQRLSQLAASVVDALRGSALTRIVWRLADQEEAAHMAKHLPGMTADKIMALPDYHAVIRRRGKGRPLVVKMLNVPKAWKPPRRTRLAAWMVRTVRRVRRPLKAVKLPLRRCLRGVRSFHSTRRTGSVPSAGTIAIPPSPQIPRLSAAANPLYKGGSRGKSRPHPSQLSILENPDSLVANLLHLPRIAPQTRPGLAPQISGEMSDFPSAQPLSDSSEFTMVQAVSVSNLPSGQGYKPVQRDLDICLVLAEHGIATTDELARMFWTGKSDRGAQDRLKTLADAGVLVRLGPNGRPHQHFALSSATASALGVPALRQLDERAVPHRLAVVDFGSALVGAAVGKGWTVRWEGEATLRRDEAIPEALRPDSRLTITSAGGKFTAWLEVDRGTEGWNWLGPKLARLAKHGGADALLVVFETPGRAAVAVKERRLPVADGIVVASSLLADHMKDPLGAIWSLSTSGDKVALPQIAPAGVLVSGIDNPPSSE